MATTPLAPSSRAFSIMRSTACRRLSSSSWVYSVTSPWRSALNPALIDLTAPMLRTTRPKATPRSCSMVMPGSVNAVVTGNVVPAAAAPVDCVMIGSTSAPRRVCQRGTPPPGGRGPDGPAAGLGSAPGGLEVVNAGDHRDQGVQGGLVPGPAAGQQHVVDAQRGQVGQGGQQAGQCRRSTPSLCSMLSANWDPGRSNRLQASPYFATRRSVFRSPLPPIRIGGCGRCSELGEFSGRARS